MRIACLLLAALLLVSAPAFSQESEPGEYRRFHAAGLFGESRSAHVDGNGLTFGGDFEVRFSRFVGVGVTGEHVSEPFRENVLVLPLIVHPTRAVKLTVGPGFERASHRNDAGEFEHFTMLRTGVSYEVPLRRGWTLDPDLAVDFVEGERVLVYSIAIGREFGRAVRASASRSH